MKLYWKKQDRTSKPAPTLIQQGKNIYTKLQYALHLCQSRLHYTRLKRVARVNTP